MKIINKPIIWNMLESFLSAKQTFVSNFEEILESSTLTVVFVTDQQMNELLLQVVYFFQCLIEGHWLVLDNVNLCSSAVLDRLNGLLEPNGELILSERGVNSAGELLTIKPHPSFRQVILSS